MPPKLLGIEIGGTKLQLVIGNGQADIQDRHRFKVDPTRGGAGIRKLLQKSLPALLKHHHPTAVGVGFGGPVDPASGTIRCSHQIAGWADFPLGSWLAELTQLPVSVDNDANTAALAEACLGAGRDVNPVFYVTLGSGVGGGCVVNRRVYHGTTPGEAEIGHLRLDRSGTTVEQRCSGWAVDRRIRALTATQPDSALARLAKADPGNEARHLPAALAANDPAAAAILVEAATDLAFALSHVTHLFHPAAIILGGGLSLLGEPLIRAVENALPGHLMSAFLPGPRVRLAQLREDAVPVGATLLAQAIAPTVDPESR